MEKNGLGKDIIKKERMIFKLKKEKQKEKNMIGMVNQNLKENI